MVAKKRANARKTPEIVRFRGFEAMISFWLHYMAAIQGFEPRQAESEAAVLPLHYIAIPRLYIKPLYYTTFRKFVKGDKC